MSKFARQLNLEKFEQPTNEPLPQWWSDLLGLWRPSGVPAGDDGLRLAVRNNYLNFYRRGQSIARVEMGADGLLKATIHAKYVLNAKQDRPGSKEYVALSKTSILRGSEFFRNYHSGDLNTWIEVVDNNHAGDEKAFVDELVAANPNIIDLEMGLPAWKPDKRVAPRIDLVAIEDGKIVFWEAKLVTDGRLRTSGDVVTEGDKKKPEVLNQLHAYSEFLDVHSELVATAYKDTFVILSRLWELAGRSDSNPAIWAPGIRPNDLEVDLNPRLVIDNRSDNKSWHKHRARLKGVRMQVIDPRDSLVLCRPP